MGAINGSPDTVGEIWDAVPVPVFSDAGSCVGTDPDVWVTDGEQDGMRDLCRRVCQRCPVRQECYDFAQLHRLDFGMWGGRTATQRARDRGEVAAWTDEAPAIMRARAHEAEIVAFLEAEPKNPRAGRNRGRFARCADQLGLSYKAVAAVWNGRQQTAEQAAEDPWDLVAAARRAYAEGDRSVLVRDLLGIGARPAAIGDSLTAA